MRHFVRAVLALSAGALALAFSSSALAAMNPKLDIGTSTQKGASSLALEARLGQTDDWLGRLQVYVPTGYKLNSPAGGATVGTAQVQALGTQVGPNLAFKMTGTVKAIGTTDPAISSYNTSCDTSTGSSQAARKLAALLRPRLGHMGRMAQDVANPRRRCACG